MKTSIKIISAFILIVAGTGCALASESESKNLSVTVGLKLWVNEWQTWGGYGVSRKTTANPSVTVKYKNLFVSAGVMPKSNYSVPYVDVFGNPQTTNVPRSEYDLSVGYYVLPQLAVTLGYKQTKQVWGATDYVWKIPAIGVSAASAIMDTKMFMYGNAAFGSAQISVTGVSGLSGGLYTTSELGLGYSIVPAFRMTVGYKYQVIPTTFPQGAGKPSITQFDTTRGLVIGGSYTF